MTGEGDRNGGAVSSGDMTVNRVWRKRVKDTGVLGEVSGTAAAEDPLRGGRESMFVPMPAAQHRRRYSMRQHLAR
jgi:hypothetical protein